MKKDGEFKKREEFVYEAADCAKMLEVRRIDLNGDRQNEFVVWGRSFNLCGANGNCVVWIYERKNGKYRRILQTTAYYGESKWFEIKKGKTKGFRNLLLKGHFTGYETTHGFYRFNGRRYVETKCWFEVYTLNQEKPETFSCAEYSNEQKRKYATAKTEENQ